MKKVMLLVVDGLAPEYFQKDTAHCPSEHCFCAGGKSCFPDSGCSWCSKYVGSRFCRCGCGSNRYFKCYPCIEGEKVPLVTAREFKIKEGMWDAKIRKRCLGIAGSR